ncbi:HlyD family efflux transporter periplasmic adaptor subunit [Mariniflexile litorale]|uniref:HlyD family efflux transporter periplasmic adaptor subunit n=1 Tax=Mariniflexile litorale TaxID=3045158 RepID=A0AAU7EK17_9FLAO|nr:HlyD family efflux transporter periplasmic adaptor subunit [Mariniflexile sp. KMM 9835]MDQ8211379.1 HlyD family efflux transporter periplasmic adaptor subunit [Mariniflexile sp. KMM 9835]
MKQIFPKEIIDNTIEVHQFNHSSKSKVIYSFILSSVLIMLVLLPFIKVDIYTSARGIIKPDKERLSVTSLNSGKIISAHLKNNRLVHIGDTLLVLDNTIINEKLKLSAQQIQDLSLFIEDLTYLVENKYVSLNQIQSPKYTKEYLLYQQKMHELQTRFKKLKQDYDRNTLLYKKEVIAKVEFENSKFEYDLAISNINQLKQQQRNTWQASLTEYKNSLLEFESKELQLQDNKSQYLVTAPITGILINAMSVEKGSFLSSGQPFVDISPNTSLLVECFINPQDIGLLKVNNPVNFQIDAYNYNQWGLASGNITDIGKDIEFIENTSVFKVQCHINQKTLKLKNGFEGELKKGMTLNAQFKLAERTLFDLLYDKVDDWVNPSQKEIVSIN